MQRLVNDLISLEGKIAVITGGSSGIGAATAKLFAQLNAFVVILDVDTDKGERLADSINKSREKATFMHCDVTLESDCKKMADQMSAQFSKVDILFNNAGVIVRKSVTDLRENEWDKVVDVSLKGAFLVSKHILPLMMKHGGSIINTGSGWSIKAGENAAAYCSAKAGILNLTRSMAIDYGKYNIRANCVCPGDTDTALLRDEAAQLGEDETLFLKEAADRPLGRMGTPNDIAKAVLFLASPMSEWVSGSSLVVDGGGLA